MRCETLKILALITSSSFFAALRHAWEFLSQGISSFHSYNSYILFILDSGSEFLLCFINVVTGKWLNGIFFILLIEDWFSNSSECDLEIFSFSLKYFNFNNRLQGMGNWSFYIYVFLSSLVRAAGKKGRGLTMWK